MLPSVDRRMDRGSERQTCPRARLQHTPAREVPPHILPDPTWNIFWRQSRCEKLSDGVWSTISLFSGQRPSRAGHPAYTSWKARKQDGCGKGSGQQGHRSTFKRWRPPSRWQGAIEEHEVRPLQGSGSGRGERSEGRHQKGRAVMENVPRQAPREQHAFLEPHRRQFNLRHLTVQLWKWAAFLTLWTRVYAEVPMDTTCTFWMLMVSPELEASFLESRTRSIWDEMHAS